MSRFPLVPAVKCSKRAENQYTPALRQGALLLCVDDSRCFAWYSIARKCEYQVNAW